MSTRITKCDSEAKHSVPAATAATEKPEVIARVADDGVLLARKIRLRAAQFRHTSHFVHTSTFARRHTRARRIVAI